MKNLTLSYLWWPSMDEAIENTSKFCSSCQIYLNMTFKAPIHPWENSETRVGRIHLDFTGPYLGKMFLVISNSYYKWLDIKPMNSINTSTLT